MYIGPALTAVWSKAPPLTVRFRSPLPWFEMEIRDFFNILLCREVKGIVDT